MKCSRWESPNGLCGSGGGKLGLWPQNHSVSLPFPGCVALGGPGCPGHSSQTLFPGGVLYIWFQEGGPESFMKGKWETPVGQVVCPAFAHSLGV